MDKTYYMIADKGVTILNVMVLFVAIMLTGDLITERRLQGESLRGVRPARAVRLFLVLLLIGNALRFFSITLRTQ